MQPTVPPVVQCGSVAPPHVSAGPPLVPPDGGSVWARVLAAARRSRASTTTPFAPPARLAAWWTPPTTCFATRTCQLAPLPTGRVHYAMTQKTAATRARTGAVPTSRAASMRTCAPRASWRRSAPTGSATTTCPPAQCPTEACPRPLPIAVLHACPPRSRSHSRPPCRSRPTPARASPAARLLSPKSEAPDRVCRARWRSRRLLLRHALQLPRRRVLAGLLLPALAAGRAQLAQLLCSRPLLCWLSRPPLQGPTRAAGV